MRKKIITAIAVAGIGIASVSGAAEAKPNTPANGACVAEGVQALKGAIGGAASTLGPRAISGVIQAHLNGATPVSNVDCSD